MTNFGPKLLSLYLQLGGGIAIGWVLGRLLPPSVALRLGQILFWVGVPLSIFSFLRQTDLSGGVWIAPIIAWAAMLLGIALAALWLRRSAQSSGEIAGDRPTALWAKSSQGSFLLSSMVGNTGYLGYPIALAIAGPQHFGWALFYDLIGSTVGAYGLGILIAARYGMSAPSNLQMLQALLKNPAMTSLLLGLLWKNQPMPAALEQALSHLAWGVIGVALVLLGMRLSQLSTWDQWPHAIASLAIKMLIVPLLLGAALPFLGLSNPAQQVLILQMAMPPAFATLVITEAYNLDRSLTVTSLAVGTLGLLMVLPFWLWLFQFQP